MRFSSSLRVFVVTVIAIAAAGMPSVSQATTTKPDVLVTFFPLFEFAHEIAGDHVNLGIIVSPGLEPHDFEPTIRDAERIGAADMFIYNGSGMEDPWVNPLLAQGTLDPTRQVIVEVLKALKEGGLLRPAQPPDEARFTNDPHVWLDPVLAQEMVLAIEKGFVKLDPAGQEFYQAKGRSFRGELALLDVEIQAALVGCKHHELVLSHQFMDYFAARYGLEAVAISGLEPEEPTIGRLEEITAYVKARGLAYVFSETLLDAKVTGIQAVAEATGAKILFLSPLEGLTKEQQSQGKTYLSVMRENIAALRIGLECVP